MAEEGVSYDKAELRSIIRAFKAMDDEAVEAAKKGSNALATFAADRIKETAFGRTVAASAVRRVAEGVRVSKSSKVGELSYGFASQRFSGGATTQILWPGLEFGSNRYRQFPRRTPSNGRGNAGYFIYPTLRAIQPELVRQWEDLFAGILKKWDN